MKEQTEPVREILRTGEPMRCDWPAGTYVQGGKRGIVLGGPDGAYRTAFVEAFPAGMFLRGEGPTVQEAEAACFAKWQAATSCPTFPDHGPWDRRNYTNGGAFCQGCGSFFGPSTTGLAEIPRPAGTEPSLMERLFTGDEEALVEVLETAANADQLPERHH